MTAATDDSKLDDCLRSIAKTGDFECEALAWKDLSLHISKLIDNAITNNFKNTNKQIEDPLTGTTQSLGELLGEVKAALAEKFPFDPPFTIQRLAELVLDPNQFYNINCPEKFVHALEHIINVASTSKEFDRLALDKELEKEEGPKGGESKKGIVLTELNWIVDTGTPPPTELMDPELADLPEKKEAKTESNENEAVSLSKNEATKSDETNSKDGGR